jgi:DNA-binding NarL/FixJ family response regulator
MSKFMLSPRQEEILVHVAQGKDNKTIARTMGISSKTVRNQLTIVFRRMNVQSRTQAAIVAIRHDAI